MCTSINMTILIGYLSTRGKFGFKLASIFILISFVAIVENLDIVMVGIFHYFSQPLLQDHDTSFQKARTAPEPVGTGYFLLRICSVQTGQATLEKSNAASWRPGAGSPLLGQDFG